ncbi:DsbA family protein [uncultured Tateyamaria sp.]|uniref:DsbA family protein n=1 Tax=uncultured Tateyamaria sp. TaxID=455651 RepID=UPI002625FD3D|nr:DsbA family protein [uncultured Tateyamaria sp.]
MRRKTTVAVIAGLIAVEGMFLKAGFAQENTTYDADFVEKVERVLLENPEIILKVFEVLERHQAEQVAYADKDLIADVSKELFAGLDLNRPILVEFQDYNCGYCRRIHPTVAQLKRDMPDLQMVLLELPVLGEASVFTAKAALALKALEGEDAYEVFANAMMVQGDTADPASVRRTLASLGFDPEAVITAAEQGIGGEDLDRAARLARAIGASGTPFFVGPGGIVRGAGSADDLKSITSTSAPEPERDEAILR